MKSGNRLSFFLCAGFVLAVLVCGTIWFARPAELQTLPLASESVSDVKVVNKIDGLEVVSTNVNGPRFIVSTRNASQKVINSFYVASGNEAWQVELIYSDTTDGVMPSAQYDITIPFSKNLAEKGVIIQALLFDDGTGAGSVDFVKIMQDRRLGEKQELTKGKRILDDILSGTNLKSKETLDQLKQKFIASESAAQAGQSESVKLGMNLGRQRFLKMLDRLSRFAETTPETFNSELNNFNRRLEKYVSKL